MEQKDAASGLSVLEDRLIGCFEFVLRFGRAVSGIVAMGKESFFSKAGFKDVKPGLRG